MNSEAILYCEENKETYLSLEGICNSYGSYEYDQFVMRVHYFMSNCYILIRNMHRNLIYIHDS